MFLGGLQTITVTGLLSFSGPHSTFLWKTRRCRPSQLCQAVAVAAVSCSRTLSRHLETPVSCLRRQRGLQAAGEPDQGWRDLWPLDTLEGEHLLLISSLEGVPRCRESEGGMEACCAVEQVDAPAPLFLTHSGKCLLSCTSWQD